MLKLLLFSCNNVAILLYFLFGNCGYFLISDFLLVFVVDWEGMWINYVSEVFMLDLMSMHLVMLSLWVSMLMLLASFNSWAVSENFLFIWF